MPKELREIFGKLLWEETQVGGNWEKDMKKYPADKQSILEQAEKFIAAVREHIEKIKNPYASCDEFCALFGMDDKYDGFEKARQAIIENLEEK